MKPHKASALFFEKHSGSKIQTMNPLNNENSMTTNPALLNHLTTSRASLKKLTLAAIAVLSLALVTESKAQSLWTNATGSAWLTTTQWNPNGVPGNTAIAQFGANPTPGTSVGINFPSPASTQQVGAIEVTSGRLVALTIGNSSGTAANTGTLQINGTTVNSVANVIVRNNSGQLLTLQNVQGSGASTMALGLGNTTDNIIQIDGTGGVTISSIITGSSRKLTRSGSGSGVLTLSAANTYSGATVINSGTLQYGNANALLNTSGITLGGASPATLVNSADITGITINGTITLANSGVSSTISYARTSAATGSLTLNGAIGGAGDLIFTSPNNGASTGNGQTINLGASSTYAGSTTMTVGNSQVALTVKNTSGTSNALPVTTVLNMTAPLGGNGTGRALLFDLNGQNQTLAGLTNGGIVPNLRNYLVTSATAATLTISNNADFTFGGAALSGGKYNQSSNSECNLFD